ncbi:prepilin peptidase CpaA [Solimonas aquatica]|uniref:Prepilin peptidase CpaA n=1 Tax=Solimonas aquatica TaxID=489703 RepID=A0A1H9H3U6_9GAMM|nr:prepilin peptidase [Solimonas aquatica]SEQ57021.1 prepilin peptidase CpaA [Solimonas aquatica]
MSIVFWIGLWAALIAIYDWRRQRIANAALIVMLVPALLALFWNGKGLLGAGPGSSLCGMLLAFVVTLPAYPPRVLGAGDVKFAAVLGLLLGLQRTLEMLLWAALLLGLAAVLMWWLKGSRKARFAAAPALTLATLLELMGGPLLL